MFCVTVKAFDDPNSDKLESLKIWDSLLTDFPNRTNTEIDYLKLCKARVLIELNRREDAKELIQTVNSKDLKIQSVIIKTSGKRLLKGKSLAKERKEHQPNQNWLSVSQQMNT